MSRRLIATALVLVLLVPALIQAGCEGAPPADPNAALERFLSHYENRPFLRETAYADGTVTLRFYETYEIYKQRNPDSQLSKNLYLRNFGGVDQVHQVLMRLPLDVLRAVPAAERVNLVLPWEGTAYGVSVSRAELAEYFGVDPGEFAGPVPTSIAQQFDEAGRTRYAERFVQQTPLP